jgi:DNA-binding NarL/FixJ family response regulator
MPHYVPHLVPSPVRADTEAERTAVRAPRVLLVDAHPFLSWALAQHLSETMGADVRDVIGADAAVQAVTDEAVDAVVVDATAGDVTALIARLRAVRPHLAAVVLPMDASLPAARTLAPVDEAVRHLPATASTDDLVEALRVTMARAGQSPFRRAGARTAAPALTLSPREQQVLELLRDGHSLPSVAATLAISMSTTKTYVARLYDKLESTSRTQVLLKALRLGLLQPETQRAG